MNKKIFRMIMTVKWIQWMNDYTNDNNDEIWLNEWIMIQNDNIDKIQLKEIQWMNIDNNNDI